VWNNGAAPGCRAASGKRKVFDYIENVAPNTERAAGPRKKPWGEEKKTPTPKRSRERLWKK